MKEEKIKFKKIFLPAFGGLFLFALIFIFVGIKQARAAVVPACFSYDYCAIDKAGSQGNICQEAGCGGQIGRLQGVAYCGVEDNAAACSDGFNNDGDVDKNGKSLIDCADPSCVNGSYGQCGQENTNVKCSDGFDNDGDGEPDCLDKDCADKGGCANWFNTTACMGGTLPMWSPDPAELLVSNGTVNVTQTSKIYTNKSHIIKIGASANYTSFTLTVGNAINSAEYFPYNISGGCILSGEDTGVNNLAMINDIAGHVLQIINKPGTTVSNLNLTLDCLLPASVVVGPVFSYPIAIDAKHSTDSGEETENGEQTFSTTAVESTPPEIDKIEVVGLKDRRDAVGGKVVDVPYGGSLYLRAVPKGGEASDVCGCKFWLGSSPNCDSATDITCQKDVFGEEGNSCLLHLAKQTYDVPNYFVRVNAENDVGVFTDYVPVAENVVPFKLNITPIVKPGTQMSFNKMSFNNNKKYPFYIPNEDAVVHSPVFVTAQESYFKVCQIKVDDIDSNVSCVNGPGSNETSFNGGFKAPAEPAQRGAHYVSFTATDNKGDSVTTGKMVFYVCSPGDTAPPCDKADFDQDGVPDRENSLSCHSDNCVNFYNPDRVDSPNQVDLNENGIGDACEHGLHCTDNLSVVCPDGQPADPDYYGTCGEVVGAECCFAGTCSVGGALCCSNSNCVAGTCKKDYEPWLETRSGDIYGGGVGLSQMKLPPGGQYNAAFCILSSGEVINFSSKKGCTKENINPLNILSSPNANDVNLFSKDVLAQLNLKNLRPDDSKPGRSSLVTTINSASDFPPDGVLGGKVYYHRGDLTLGSLDFRDGPPNTSAEGNGLLFVEGNLIINGDWQYKDVSGANEKNLASLGVLVLGNINFDGAVKNTVGFFFASGTIDTGSLINSPKDQLNIQGAMAARNFAFKRTFLSETEGSEVIIYDGRAQINPPPGLGDFFKALPLLRQTLP